MPDDVFSLFDEYAARFVRGERPEARVYLLRAGADADELAQLIDGYLARATPPPPSEDAVALTTAALHGRSPLLEARERRGLTPGDVVDALIAALSLDRAKRAKVLRYYQELEAPIRDPARVDRRVFEALAATLRTTASDLLGRGPLRPREAFSYLWAEPTIPPPAAAASAAMRLTRRPEPPDEIDRLFGLG
jgi:hypothetical protein